MVTVQLSHLFLFVSLSAAFLPSEDLAISVDIPNKYVNLREGTETKQVGNNDGGIFGFWRSSEGLPYFEYTMDELTNPESSWPNTEQVPPLNVTRTDHFYLFGNSRINVKAVDDGYMEIFGSDRGPMWCNYYEPDYSNLAGGFSYISWISSNQKKRNTFSTAYKYGPHSSNVKWTREFHIGAYKSSLTVDDIQLRRTTTAPFGDYSFVIDEIEIQNMGSSVINNFEHYEYWDINYWQMELEWFRTGYFAAEGDARRHDINRKFLQEVSYNSATGIMKSSMVSTDTPPVSSDTPSEVNYYPLDMFLAVLDGNIHQIFWNQTSFFGSGNFSQPAAVMQSSSGDASQSASISALDQNFAFIMQSTLNLQPSETITLRFAYGYVPAGESVEEIIAPFRQPTVPTFTSTTEKWKEQAASVNISESSAVGISTEDRIAIEREIIWRSAQLQASSLYHDYFTSHVIPQGSEYLYLSGADGAPRDFFLSLAANVLLDPELSKETLKLSMKMQSSTTGGMWYAIGGYGEASPALGLHKFPSDLDIFLFFAFNEYMSATGDTSFITEDNIPFYPKSSDSIPPGANGTTILDHVRAAFSHLKNTVGLGPHGLIRILQGDWDDGVVYSDPDPLAILFSIEHGESIPNTQMALYCLPITAKIIEPFDSDLAQDMQNFANSLEDPVKKAFGTKWFGRAWLRSRFDVPYLRGNDNIHSNSSQSYIDLEAQPWGLLLEDILNPSQEESIYQSINTYLDNPSPIGPLQSPNGYVWPAISQLLPWAYAKKGLTENAWRIFQEHLYATHARYFPDVWMGIWSGPDGWVAYLPESGFEIHGYEGGTWYSLFTPMTDFPVSNSNPDAMYCLALQRLLGVEPSADGDGLFINVTRAGFEYSMSYPILQISYSDGIISGTYSARFSGNLNLSVALEESATKPSCEIQNQPYPCVVNNMQVKLPIGPFSAGDIVSFRILP